ncbi:MAG: hypothetical protein PUF55_03690 [Bacteroidales bacterium]|nr:hypothetical protein [Bacteroidales bacterium]
MTFAAFRDVILYVLNPKTVKSEAARLTIWDCKIDLLGCKIDYIEGFFAGFLTTNRKNRKRNFTYPAECQQYTQKAEKQQIIAVKQPHGRPDGFYSDFFLPK